MFFLNNRPEFDISKYNSIDTKNNKNYFEFDEIKYSASEL